MWRHNQVPAIDDHTIALLVFTGFGSRSAMKNGINLSRSCDVDTPVKYCVPQSCLVRFFLALDNLVTYLGWHIDCNRDKSRESTNLWATNSLSWDLMDQKPTWSNTWSRSSGLTPPKLWIKTETKRQWIGKVNNLHDTVFECVDNQLSSLWFVYRLLNASVSTHTHKGVATVWQD